MSTYKTRISQFQRRLFTLVQQMKSRLLLNPHIQNIYMFKSSINTNVHRHHIFKLYTLRSFIFQVLTNPNNETSNRRHSKCSITQQLITSNCQTFTGSNLQTYKVIHISYIRNTNKRQNVFKHKVKPSKLKKFKHTQTFRRKHIFRIKETLQLMSLYRVCRVPSPLSWPPTDPNRGLGAGWMVHHLDTNNNNNTTHKTFLLY